MKDKGLVSVVTATYNMGEYACLAVNSVLQQTYCNVESIVVDDGSSDGTPEKMACFSDDPRVNFIRLAKNQGQAAAKNTGLRAAKGDFLAFVDADNIWNPDKLEKQLPLFDKSEDIGVVYSDVQLIDGKGDALPYVPRAYHEGQITAPLLLHNFVNFNSTVVKRECIKKKGIFDETLDMGIDWDLWLRISTDFDFAFLDETTYCYRIWSNQMSHNKLKRLECAEKILNKFFCNNEGAVSSKWHKLAWSKLYCDYGSVYAAYKDRPEAICHYGRAIRISPFNRGAWKGLARLIVKLG